MFGGLVYALRFRIKGFILYCFPEPDIAHDCWVTCYRNGRHDLDKLGFIE